MTVPVPATVSPILIVYVSVTVAFDSDADGLVTTPALEITAVLLDDHSTIEPNNPATGKVRFAVSESFAVGALNKAPATALSSASVPSKPETTSLCLKTITRIALSLLPTEPIIVTLVPATLSLNMT